MEEEKGREGRRKRKRGGKERRKGDNEILPILKPDHSNKLSCEVEKQFFGKSVPALPCSWFDLNNTYLVSEGRPFC